MQRGRFKLDHERVYAEAKAAGLADQLEDELYSFSRLVNDHYDFKLFLEDPRIRADYKKNKLTELFPPGLSANFLALVFGLIDQGREELVEELSRELARSISKDRGILFGEVTSLVRLNDDQRARLAKAIGRLERSPVRLRYRVDRELLGGLCVKLINGGVWDVSLRHKLDDLRTAMAG